MAFIMYRARNTKTTSRMRRRRKIYSGSKKKKQHTYSVKNLHSKNELGLIIYESKHKQGDR